MSIRKAAMATIVAVSMVVVPTIAQAAQAHQTAVSKLSVARAGAKTSKENDLRGGSIILALLAAAAVIAGIVIAADGSNKPSSP
jgi:hypothetical protein